MNPDFLAYRRCVRQLSQTKDVERANLLQHQINFHCGRLKKRRNKMSTDTIVAHQSRWGHHPCSYDTFRKLKEIHRYYWQSIRWYAQWSRWDRKEPQNRVIRRWTRDDHGRKIRHEIVGPSPEPIYCPYFVNSYGNRHQYRFRYRVCDLGIIEAYQQARHPSSLEKVQPLTLTTEEIDQLHKKVKDWFVKNKPSYV